jgi:WD40 repeat protein
VASASVDHEIRVWDAETGKVLWRAKSIESDFKRSSPLPTVLAWSHDSRRLAFPQAGFEIGIVDATSGKPVRQLTGHSDVVYSLAWSPDGSHIVSGGEDKVLRVWNAVTGRPVKTRPMGVAVNAVCWSPDSSRIAGAASDNAVYIWDLKSLPGPPRHRLGGHANYVYTVAWSFDGERIASADESGSIRIWEARTGQETLSLSYPRAVPMVAWNPDGKRLACVGFGGSASVRIWNAAVEPSGPVSW